MTHTPTENELLRLIAAETMRVSTLSPHRDWERDDVNEFVARRIAIRDFAAGLGVRISTDWLGNSPSDRQRRSRGLRALELAGLVELLAVNSTRVSHVRLIAPDDADEGVTASPLPRPASRVR